MRTRFPKTGKSFLFGVIGGASLALLLAPAPGSETRSLIHRQGQHTAVATRQFGDRIVRKGREALHFVATSLERCAAR